MANLTLSAGVDASTVTNAPAAAVLEHGEPRTLETVDEVADALDQNDGFFAEEKASPSPEHDENTTEQQQNASEDDQNAAEQQQDAQEAYPVPEGIEANTWASLAPEARAIVSEREKAHAEAIQAERIEQARIMKNRDAYLVQANQVLNRAKAFVEAVTRAEYGGINWDSLDAETHVRLRKEYDQRINALEQIQGEILRVEQAYTRDRITERNKSLDMEVKTVEPKLKALLGADYNRQAFVADTVNYLSGLGVPESAMGNITKGYEIEIIAKAMAHDKAAGLRKMAAKKIAEAPQVSAPRSPAPGERGDAYTRARATLKKHSNSTDALAAVFDAM